MTHQISKKFRHWTWLIRGALVAVSLLPTGCSDDLNPFVLFAQPAYKETDLESDSRLIGDWENQDEDQSLMFSFAVAGDRKESVYELRVTETDGAQPVEGRFEAHLVRLGASFFLDLYPDDNVAWKSVFHRLHFVRTHTVARVQLDDTSLQITFLSASWLKQKLQEKSIPTSYVEVNDSLLLVGTTEEFQDLLYSYADDDKAFPDTLLLRKRQGEDCAQ